jgi:TRAP-type uncharacterized transport system substrate-binding protein
MRFCSTIILVLAISSIAGWAESPDELLMVRPAQTLDAEIAQDIVELFATDSGFTITMTATGQSDELALDTLLAGEADIALVSNNMPYHSGISTVMPMYPTVLHVGYFGEREFANATELIRGASVYAGPAGSASRRIFERFTSRMDLDPGDYSYVASIDENPDVFVVFGPISPDRLEDIHDVRLVNTGSPEDIGTGSSIDAVTLMNPQLKPFVIPVGTYGEATPTPILTVAVDMMLVARSDLSESVVYDLVRDLNRLRPALASLRPGLFERLDDDFNTGNSTFVLHPGLVAYLERNEPTVYERYSGIAEVVVTVIVALFSASFAGVRIYRIRRKNRIDTFYTDVIAIRNSLDDSSSKQDRAAAAQKIRDLQNTAFEMLVDEKLSADESFRIFISLSNDALRDLGAVPTDSGVRESP